VMSGDWVQAALLERGLDGVGVPRLNAPREAVEDGLHLRSTDAEAGIGDRRRRRRRHPAANDDPARVLTDVQHGLLPIVTPDLPAHERRVERGGLLVV